MRSLSRTMNLILVLLIVAVGTVPAKEAFSSAEPSGVTNSPPQVNAHIPPTRVVAYYERGELVGYRVFAIRDGSIFDKVGLKNGDILHEVNGRRVEAPEDVLGLADVIMTEPQLIIRGYREGDGPLVLKYSAAVD